MSILERKYQLNNHQLQIVSSEFDKVKKENLIGYLLWLVFGMFGGHRFYVGKIGTAIVQLFCTITVFGAIVSLVWAFIDLFFISEMVRKKNDEIEEGIIDKVNLLAANVVKNEEPKKEDQ